MLLPLCPLLVSAALDVAPEEPVILLPEVSMEVVCAFLNFIYQGHCVLSSASQASEVQAVRDLMASFGLHIPDNRWSVEGLPPSLLQVGQEEAQPVEPGQGEGGEEVERNDLEPPETSDQLQPEVSDTIAGSGNPASAEEMSAGEISSVSSLGFLVEQASLVVNTSSAFTERGEEDSGERNQGQGVAREEKKDSTENIEGEGEGSSKDQVRAGELSDEKSVEDQKDQSKQPRPDPSRTKEPVEKTNDEVDKGSGKDGTQSVQDPKFSPEDLEESKQPSKDQNRKEESPETSSEDDDEEKNGEKEEEVNNNEDDDEKPGKEKMILPISNVGANLGKLPDEDVPHQMLKMSPSQTEEPLDLSVVPFFDLTDMDDADECRESKKRKGENVEEKNLENDQDEIKYHPVTKRKKEGKVDRKKEIVAAPKGIFEKFCMIAKGKKVEKNLQKLKKQVEKTSAVTGKTAIRNMEEQRKEQKRQVEESIRENKNKKYLGFGETKPEEPPRKGKKVRSLKKAAKSVSEEEKALMEELCRIATSESADSQGSDI